MQNGDCFLDYESTKVAVTSIYENLKSRLQVLATADEPTDEEDLKEEDIHQHDLQNLVD